MKTLGTPNNFLSPDLSTNDPTIKSGFSTEDAGLGLAVAGAPASCVAPQADYWAEAHPINVGTTGTRSFGTTSQGTIYQDTTSATFAAPAAPPAAPWARGTVAPIQ